MIIKRINYIPYLNLYEGFYGLNKTNRRRWINSILNKKGKHYKNYCQYLIDYNLKLEYDNLEFYNNYKYTYYQIKNSRQNYKKCQYNINILEREYRDFKEIDYREEVYYYFRIVLKANFMKFCRWISDGNDTKTNALLFKGDYLFEELKQTISSIISNILFDDNIKESITNYVDYFYRRFLDKLNIDDADYLLKKRTISFNFKDVKWTSTKRNIKYFIKKNYILEDDIYHYHRPQCHLQPNVETSNDLLDKLLFIKIMDNNKDVMTIIDNNVIQELNKNNLYKKRQKKRSEKENLRKIKSRIKELEKELIPKHISNNNIKQKEICEKLLIKLKNKISIDTIN